MSTSIKKNSIKHPAFSHIQCTCCYICLLAPMAKHISGISHLEHRSCMLNHQLSPKQIPLMLLQRAGGCKFYSLGCYWLIRVLQHVIHPSTPIPHPDVVLCNYKTILLTVLFCISFSKKVSATAGTLSTNPSEKSFP